MTDSLSQPWMTIVLATLAPTAAFVALNLRFFTLRQAVASLALAASAAGILGAGAALLCGWVSPLSLSMAAAEHGVSVAGGLTTLLALSLYFILHERFFTEAVPRTCTRRLIMAVLMLVFGLSSALYSPAVINGVFMLLLVSSCLDALRQRKAPKEPLFALASFRQHYTPRSTRNVTLAHKPNVYLLLLESYHSSEALQTLYGIDDSATDAIFAKHGFTDYPGVYSNEPATVASLHTLVDGTLLGSVLHARGNAFIFDVLRENGYSCEFFDSSFFVFGHLIAEGEYAAFDMPTYVRLLYALAGPLWAQSRYLRKIVNNFDPFETEINFSAMFNAFQKRLAHKVKTPRCFCMRFGACHVENSHQSWLEDASQFQKTYIESVRKGQGQIAQVVESIMQHDPDALVVAVGDHGSLRHSNAWRGAGGMDDVLRKRCVSMATLALDHFGVRLAIRWPVPHKTAGKVISHVNIFRYVLEALGGGKDLLEHLQPNISLLEGQYMVVRDGKPVEQLHVYNPKEALQLVRQRFEAGQASLEDCLTLAYTLEQTDPYFVQSVLLWADATFPENAGLHVMLGKLLCAQGREEGLGYLERALNVLPHDKNLLAYYWHALLRFKRPQEVVNDVQDREATHLPPDVLFIVMVACCQLGREDDALAFADTFINQHKNIPTAYFYEGLLLHCLKRHEQSFALTKQALERFYSIKSDSLLCHLRRVHMVNAVLTKRWGEAMAIGKVLCERYSEETWNWLLYSFASEQQGNVAEAFEILFQGMERCSASDVIARRMGYLAREYHLSDASLQPLVVASGVEIVSMQELCKTHDVIDVQWYRTQVKNAKGPIFPHRHYLMHGLYEGLEIVPWFDSFYYLLTDSTIWKLGINPFVHFLQCGQYEGRPTSIYGVPTVKKG